MHSLLLRLFISLIILAGTHHVAMAQSPTAQAVSPQAAISCTMGDTLTFTINAEDADGDLRGAEWYGNPASPSTVMLSIVSKTHSATMSKDILFDRPGVFEITVSAFDLNYDYSSSLKWTVHVTPPAHENPLTYRSLYVDGFDDILGDSAKEQELLSFLKDQSFSEIALYGLNPILTQNAGYTTRTAQLRSFISTAKTSYGIVAVKGIGCMASDFDDIATYNENSAANERFNGLVSEYEYWNPNTEGTCSFGATIETFTALLSHMRTIADARGMTVDAYMGWLGTSSTKADEASRIAALVDIVYLHAYRADPYTTYPYIEDRLSHFSQAENGIRIRPIFSAEWRPLAICSEPHATGVNNECFMGQWYESNTIRKAENLFMDFYDVQKSSLPGNVTMDGYQYFAYSFLKASIEAEAQLSSGMYHILLSE